MGLNRGGLLLYVLKDGLKSVDLISVHGIEILILHATTFEAYVFTSLDVFIRRKTCRVLPTNYI